MEYTQKYLDELEAQSKLNEEENDHKPGGYYSTHTEDDELRENGAARMFERYGFF